MSYLTLLENDNKASNQLLVLNPRVVIDTFTSLGGGNYSKSFTLGPISQVRNGTTLLTIGSSSSTLTAGQFFYDRLTKTLFFNLAFLPSSLIVTYKIFAGTEGVYWHEDPLDTATPSVYYEPLISSPASNAVSSGDILQGFFPRFSTSVSFINTEGFFQNIVYESTFNRAPISVYHYVNKLKPTSIALFLVGQTGEISYSEDTVTFKIFDNTQSFDDDFYFGDNRVNTIQNSDFSAFGYTLDPSFQGSFLRTVIGYSPMVIGFNLEYNAESTTGNKRFGFCHRWRTPTTHGIEASVLSSPSSTTTRTYVDSVSGFNVGDGFRHPNANICTVTAVGSNFIDHTLATSPAAAFSFISRPAISRVYVEKEGKIIPLNPLKISYTDGTGGFEFLTPSVVIAGKTLAFIMIVIPAINVGVGKPFPDGINANDRVYATIYGDQKLPQVNSLDFGGLSQKTKSISNPVVVILDTLLNRIGISESAIDVASFQAAYQTTVNAGDEIGFISPEDTNTNNLKYREIFNRICSSSFLKIFLDYTGRFKIYHLTSESASTWDYEITDDEILESSFSTDISYQDLASVIKLNYSKSNAKLEVISISNSVRALEEGNSRVVYKTNSDTENFENVSISKELNSYHFNRDQAINHADKLSSIFGQAIIRVRVTLPIEYYPIDLSNRVKIIRKSLIGFPLDQDILRERIFLVSSVTRSLDKVELELEDLKAVRENAALFSGA